MSMYRMFGGKRYEKETTKWSKKEADRVAADLRRKGHRARVVKSTEGDRFSASGKGWSVYVRSGKLK